MSVDKDDEFLLWVANRLVYRYGENPTIVNRIISIIAKNRLVRSSYKEGNKNTVLSIGNTIKYLENLQNTLRVQHQSLVNKISQDNLSIPENQQQRSVDFDNIDVDSIIRGI